MAISREDKKDVKNAMGKALANKVDRATNDRKKLHVADMSGGMRHHFSPSKAQVATKKGEDEAKKYGRKMYNNRVSFD